MKIGLKTILPSSHFDNHSFVEKETEEFFEFGLTISSPTRLVVSAELLMSCIKSLIPSIITRPRLGLL